MKLGEVVICREDAQSALEAWERADQHFRRGTLGQERSVGAHRRARVAAGRLAQRDSTDQDQEEEQW